MSFTLTDGDQALAWDKGEVKGGPIEALLEARAELEGRKDQAMGATPTGPWFEPGTPEHAFLVLRQLMPEATIAGDSPKFEQQPDELGTSEEPVQEGRFEERLHPRGRHGQWIEKLFTAAEAGKLVGIRAHGRGGNPISETLEHHQHGSRDTGHFGTGVYFVSSAERIPELLNPAFGGGDRGLVGIDISDAKLYRPRSEQAAFELHDALAQVNWVSANEGGEWHEGGAVKPLDIAILDLPARRADGSLVDAEERKRVVLEATKAAAEDMADGRLDGDSASTRVMKALGYNGVDNRGYELLDNSRFGSVIYRPDERDLPEKAYKVLGTDGDITDCELCGRTDLKGTVALEDTQTGEVVHFGSDCAARATGWSVKEVKDKTSAADKAERERQAAERQAANDAKMQGWEAWLQEKTGETDISAALQKLGGFGKANALYEEERGEGSAAPEPERAPLSQVVYIAEGAMERAGQTGRKWKTPKARNDTPEVEAAHRAMSEFASEAYLKGGGAPLPTTMSDGSPVPEGALPVRVVATEYLKVEYGEGAKASANLAMHSISVLHETDDLTILHEVAHLLAKTEEGADGHTPEYARIAHDLYRRHLGEEAAGTYWGIVGLRVEAPTMGKVLDDFIEKHGPYAYHETGLANVAAIEREGIRSDEEVQGMGLAGEQRPGTAYLWLPTRSAEDHERWPVRVDLRKLDPAQIVNDEDAAEVIYPNFPIEKMRGREDLAAWIAKQADFDSPERIAQGMEKGTVGYKGTIPAEAIDRNPAWFAKPENVAKFESTVESERQFRGKLEQVTKDYEELQRRLNAGEYAGRSGQWAWDADGSTYMLTSGDKPIWMANDNPPPEIDEEMERSGVQSKWRQSVAKSFGEPGYAPTEYERITANFPTEGGGTKERTLLARVQRETPDLITAIEVKKDGDEWHGKDGTQQRVVMMHPSDIVKREPMRMSLKYGELEPGEAKSPERSARSKGRTRASEIGTLKAMLLNPDLSAEDRQRYSLQVAELEGDTERAEKIRAHMTKASAFSPISIGDKPPKFKRIASGEYTSEDGRLHMFQIPDLRPPGWNVEWSTDYLWQLGKSERFDHLAFSTLLVDGAASMKDAAALLDDEWPQARELALEAEAKVSGKLAEAPFDEVLHPRGRGGRWVKKAWRQLAPGDRVRHLQTGEHGSVERVHVAPRGVSRGQNWVRVKWERTGSSGRVSNPGMAIEHVPETSVHPVDRRISSTVGLGREQGRGKDAGGASRGLEPGRARRVPAAGEPGRRDLGAAETTDYEAFNAALDQNAHPEFLTRHSAEELAHGHVFMTPDGHAGFAVTPDGDLQNVFRNEGSAPGTGRALVREAVEEHGARTLDCYDGNLPSIYGEVGFKVVGYTNWNDEYAPDGWDYEHYGRPAVLFMAVVSGELEVREFAFFDEGKAHARSLVQGE